MKMKNFPDILIGMQLVGWDDQRKILTVKDENGKPCDLVFDDSNEGDCCGYNDFFAELLVSDHDASLNPIITRVEVKRPEENYFEDNVKITFFGGAKKIFCIDSESGSGSGWCYGACVTVKCEAIDLYDYVTVW